MEAIRQTVHDNRWIVNPPRQFEGDAWRGERRADPGVITRSAFDPYIATGTIFTRTVEDMPVDSRSSIMAQWMKDNPFGPGGFGHTTSLNTSAYNIPIYLIDSRVPEIYRRKVTPTAAKDGDTLYWNPSTPMPEWATAQPSGDRAIAIYDLGTGVMRESWAVNMTAGDGSWTVAGGYSLGNPGLADLGDTNFAMQTQGATSAVVGMHNPLTQIGIVEARRKRIDHALSFTCQNMARGRTSWPARGHDGLDKSGNAPAEGQWCRFPPGLDIDSGPWPEFTKVVMRAMQTYGAYAADKNLFVCAFNAEHPAVEMHYGLPNPWTSEISALYDGGLSLDGFPWELTEWAPLHWGRPGGWAPPYPPALPRSLAVSVDGSSATATWDYAEHGPYGADSYDVSLDGGAWVSVGYALTWTAAGLTAGSHAIQVRSRGPAASPTIGQTATAAFTI